MLTGILLGNSYLFIAITGEKAQRITEQIITAITPQSWIDGKILGLAVLALVHLLSYVLGYFLYRMVCVFVWDEPLGLPQPTPSPDEERSPTKLGWVSSATDAGTVGPFQVNPPSMV